MTDSAALWQFLQDPIVLLAGVLVAGVAWRLSGARTRRLRRQRAALRVRARHAASPRERRELMLQWNELGGLRERERGQRHRAAREEGQKARAAGRPLRANPYLHAWWGPGRLWKRGWQSVERRIRWLESHR